MSMYEDLELFEYICTKKTDAFLQLKAMRQLRKYKHLDELLKECYIFNFDVNMSVSSQIFSDFEKMSDDAVYKYIMNNQNLWLDLVPVNEDSSDSFVMVYPTSPKAGYQNCLAVTIDRDVLAEYVGLDEDKSVITGVNGEFIMGSRELYDQIFQSFEKNLPSSAKIHYSPLGSTEWNVATLVNTDNISKQFDFLRNTTLMVFFSAVLGLEIAVYVVLRKKLLAFSMLASEISDDKLAHDDDYAIIYNGIKKFQSDVTDLKAVIQQSDGIIRDSIIRYIVLCGKIENYMLDYINISHALVDHGYIVVIIVRLAEPVSHEAKSFIIQRGEDESTLDVDNLTVLGCDMADDHVVFLAFIRGKESDPVEKIADKLKLFALDQLDVQCVAVTSCPVRLNPEIKNIYNSLYEKATAIGENNKFDRKYEIDKWIKRYISDHLSDPQMNIDEIAYAASISPSSLYNQFKSKNGMTLSKYILTQRINFAQKLLLDTEWSVEDILKQSGFQSKSHFFSVFKSATDMTPTSYRLKGRLNPQDRTHI